MDIYVYYRIPDHRANEWQARIHDLQAQLTQRHGVRAQLKRRPASTDGRQTWMEVYLDISPAFETQLTAAVAEAGLLALIDGERHVEHFLDCTACV